MVKALETLGDGRILVLYRMRSADDLRLMPFLSVLDLASCPTNAPCPALTAPVVVPGIRGADFEGVTQLPDRRILMRSDDKTAHIFCIDDEME